MPECIIVVPCYNEAKRLDVRAFLDHAVREGECFLFVNDGSTDSTRELLDELCAALPESFSVLHLEANGGKAEAVRRGVLEAFTRRPRYIGYWDADLATPLAAIAEFRTYLDRHPGAELLLGSRVRLLGRRIERRTSRHFAGRLFATCASAVLGLPVYDTQCGAKMFRATERLRGVFAEPFRSRWIFDVELLARLLKAIAAASEPASDEPIHEWPLAEWRDVAGSKLQPRDFLQAALQLADIWRHYGPIPRRQAVHFDSHALPALRPAAAPPAARPPTATEATREGAKLESVR